jgi:hypothetical protein
MANLPALPKIEHTSRKNKGFLQDHWQTRRYVTGGGETCLLISTLPEQAIRWRFDSKNLLARIYLALDESQRQRAAQMIHRYRHLIPDYGGNQMTKNKIG